MTTENYNLVFTERGSRVVSRGVDNIGRSSSKSNAAVSLLKKGLLGFGAVMIARNTINRVISATIEQERVTAQLEAAMKSTGNTAGFTKQEYIGMANELQSLTGIANETIQGSQNLLLTFTKIGRDTFPQAQQAAIDLSVAMGTDLRTATMQVGRALNDTELGMTALRRSGIQFTDTQKELVKEFVRTGQEAKAQQVILKELDRQFGGSAVRARDTLGGAIKQLKEDFADLFKAETADTLRDGIENLIELINDPSFISGMEGVVNMVMDLSAVALAAAENIGKMYGGLRIIAFGSDDLISREKQVTNEIKGLLIERENLIQGFFDRSGVGRQGMIDLPATTPAAQNLDRIVLNKMDELDEIRSELYGKDYATAFEGMQYAAVRAKESVAEVKEAVESTQIGSILPSDEQLAAAQKAFDDIVKQYDTVGTASNELKEKTAALKEAQELLGVSSDYAGQLLEALNRNYKDAIDPIGAVNELLENEENMIRMTNQQRDIDIRLRDIQNDLLSKNVVLGREELQVFRERLEAMQKDSAIVSQRESVLRTIRGSQEELKIEMMAVNELVKDGAITQLEADRQMLESTDNLIQATIDRNSYYVEQHEQTYARINELRNDDIINELTANKLKEQADKELSQARLTQASEFFGDLASLSSSGSRKIAMIGKAAALTQATIQGISAVQGALAAPPFWPANAGSVISVGVKQAANVASIAGQSIPAFAFGGDFRVGGKGGTDSQLVAFRATPDETVSIRTPSQVRGDERAEGKSQSVSIINVVDPAIMHDYMQSADGEKVIINTLRKNRTVLKQVVA